MATAGLMESREIPEFRKSANIDVGKGIYVAVLVASFGGVNYSMGRGDKIMVHPFALLMASLPVFSMQLTTIFALRVDLDVSRPIYEQDLHEYDHMLLHMKLLMILVAALINFQKLLRSLRLLLMVLNPHFWVEMYNQRSEFNTNGCRNRVELLAVMPVVSLTMLMAVSYIICADSISIILDSQSVKDVVFNSLAVAFVMDLDDYWWDFLMRVFNFSSLDGFTFEVDHYSQVYTEDGDLTPEKADMFWWPGPLELFLRLTPCLGSSDAGGEVLTWFVLFMLYQRQLVIVLFALDTGILPAARDICVQHYWFADTNFRASLMYLMDKFLLVDINEEIAETVAEKLHNCTDGEYDSMGLRAALDVSNKYPLTIAASCLLFVAILLVPTAQYVMWSRTASESEEDRGVLFDETQEQAAVSHGSLQVFNFRLQRVEDMLESMILQQSQGFGGFRMPDMRGWQ